MTQHKKRIVIVGGGFGGIKTALQLADEPGISVTLVSDKDHFVYYPAMYSTATGNSHRQSIAPLREVFTNHPSVTLVQGEMVNISPKDKHIQLASQHVIPYDIVVLAMGVVTTYFGIKGLDTYSYGIKSYDELQRFKRHLHTSLIDDRELDQNYIIVGAGPTGVELSAAMASYLKRIKAKHGITSRRHVHISLIEAAPRVLPRMSESASRAVAKRLTALGVKVQTNKRVESADDDSIIISGKDVPSKTIVWTSGVSNHPFYAAHNHLFSLAPNGRVIVNQQLEAGKDIFVIGDNAATPYTGFAQTD